MKRGASLFIVPVFIPQQGCRHNCVFCDQSAITGRPREIPSPEAVESEIDEFLRYNASGKPAMLAFYGGNFLGLPENEIDSLLKTAEKFVEAGKIRSIRFSTRPDTVTRDSLAKIGHYSVSDIEIGVQSMDDSVLQASRRGHCALDTENAVRELKKAGYKTGLQTMIGLPGQSRESAFDTARKIADLEPDFVRIYPTVVLKNSALAHWTKSGAYRPLSLEEAVTQTQSIYLLFESRGIPVVRMGLQASAELDEKETVLAGPYHPAFGHLVLSEIALDRISEFYEKHPPASRQAVIKANPKTVSRVRGIRNSNIAKLKARFGFDEVVVVADSTIEPEMLSIEKQFK